MLSALANTDTPSHLPYDPFLKRFSLLDLPGTAQQAVICQFDVNHYRPALFELLDIAMPAKLAGAKDSRCADYLAGRCAARQALAMAGADEVAPLRGASGEVLWPPDLQGAISHHGDHALCVVSREGFPGIDLERVMRPEVAKYEGEILTRVEKWKVDLQELERHSGPVMEIFLVVGDH